MNCSCAGTVGAVLTCPLEVVKTRQQSSSAFLPQTQRLTDIAARATTLPGNATAANSSDSILRPEQQRRLYTTILKKRRQQVFAISHCGISSSAKSMSIWQCLK